LISATYMQFRGPGFEIEIPTDWLITSAPEYQVMFLGPKYNGELRPNLVITIRPVDENVFPEQIAKETQKIQEKEYPEYQVLEEVDYGKEGGTAFLHRYSWHNSQYDKDILQIQCFFVVARILFTITATRPRDYEQTLDEIFEYMIGSFRLSLYPKQ